MPVIRRLLLTYLTLALVVLAGLALPFGYVYQRAEQQHALTQLEHDAETLAAFIDTAQQIDDDTQVETLVRDAARRWDARIEMTGDSPRHTLVVSEISGGTMSVEVPVHPGEPLQGTLRVTVSSSSVTASISQFRIVLVGVGIAVLMCSALIALALARWIGRPVRDLERATRSLADGAATPASTTNGPPELRRLAVTFNTTAARLQELIAAQRSFLAHASHQLKTPLTALRLRLENLEPDVAAEAGNNLRAAVVETDRLAGMVDTLLAMTRTEHRALPPEPAPVAALVRDRLAVWRPVADERGATLVADGPDSAVARAVPGSLEQILDNLLDNALTVAPAGSIVTVTWQDDGDTVDLHVVDAGPGLTGEQRGQALQAFWRAPDAPKGGTGLGLALVDKLAAASGGRIRLDAATPTGLDATVTLPAAHAGV
ncbi:sensor histidine kinase [Actinoplanes subglobosus]|uniref:histidine kinase n=1 Tax=Actinoplanes subglobosus TaxID=1547892 RepID=A0ABV8J6D1_9ACTN